MEFIKIEFTKDDFAAIPVREYANPLDHFRGMRSLHVHIVIMKLGKILTKHGVNAEEKFRKYLVKSNTIDACRYIRDFKNKELLNTVQGYGGFLSHLMAIMTGLRRENRRDLLLILMENYIPIGALISEIPLWVAESDLELIKLYLKQGRTIREVGQRFETSIAFHGSIDVLEFFLALEDEGKEQIFHHDIVYEACRNGNVDILDRLLVRGYQVNSPGRWGNYYPIYTTIKRKDSLHILDRLIMYGVDINLIEEQNLTPLVYSYMEKNYECLARLVDIGARIDNERDIPEIFAAHHSNRDSLLKLVEAGLDLQYRTSEGTPLEIIRKRRDYCQNHHYDPTYQPLTMEDILTAFDEAENLVSTLITEQGEESNTVKSPPCSVTS